MCSWDISTVFGLNTFVWLYVRDEYSHVSVFLSIGFHDVCVGQQVQTHNASSPWRGVQPKSQFNPIEGHRFI